MASRKDNQVVGCARVKADWNDEENSIKDEIYYCDKCGKNKDECEKFRNSDKSYGFTKIRKLDIENGINIRKKVSRLKKHKY